MVKNTGRPNQGKSETIKQRSLYVYLPTVELTEEWKAAAKAVGLPISQYVLECVEKSRSKGETYALPRLNLEKNLNETKEELANLQSRYNILDAAYVKRELEAKKLYERLGKTEMDKLPVFNMAKELAKAMRDYQYEEIELDEVIKSMSINLDEGDKVTLFRNALALLEDVGIVKLEHEFFLVYKWLANRPSTVKSPNLKERMAEWRKKNQ
jgi:Ca2+-binding EF-hand superfamily protein